MVGGVWDVSQNYSKFSSQKKSKQKKHKTLLKQ